MGVAYRTSPARVSRKFGTGAFALSGRQRCQRAVHLFGKVATDDERHGNVPSMFCVRHRLVASRPGALGCLPATTHGAAHQRRCSTSIPSAAVTFTSVALRGCLTCSIWA